MKYFKFLFLLSFFITLESCSNTRAEDENVVKRTYKHKYGLMVSKSNWESRGKNGIITTTHTDGTVSKENYSDGVLDGESTYSYPHSETIARTVVYENGRKLKETVHFSTGIPKSSTIYTGPHEHTLSTWFNTGTPRSVETFVDDKLVSGQYFSPDNKLEETVISGNGKRPQRDSYGQLTTMDTIHDGFLSIREEFHSNGIPKTITPYHNNEVHGELRTFLANGEPQSIETWMHGQQTGTTTVFRNGERFAEVPYIKGVKHGMERRFKNGDVVVEVISWNEGKKHGPSETFVEGQTSVIWFFDNMPVTKAIFDQKVRAQYIR